MLNPNQRKERVDNHITSFFQPRVVRERDEVFGESFAKAVPLNNQPVILEREAPRSLEEKSTQVLMPFFPAIFPVETPSPLMSAVDTVRGRWASNMESKDTVEQARLREEYISMWRGAGQLHYTFSGELMESPETVVKASLPLSAPGEDGAVREDERLGKKRKVTHQPGDYVDDLKYLQRVREKQRVMKRIPEVFYNDMLVAFYDMDRVALGFTIDPIPGRESLKVLPLKYEADLNASISIAESSSSSSTQGSKVRKGCITAFLRETGCYA